MTRRTTLILGILLALMLCALPRHAAADPCDAVKQFLADKTLRVVCFHSDDLRTNTTTITDNTTQPPAGPTTPPNNSITTFADGTPLPGTTALGSAFSFTPVRDRGVISNGPSPTSNAVPGIQVEGWFADDPAGEARFLLRFPDKWNGKLVIGGASGTRSEFNGDWAWSDYVISPSDYAVHGGYAYASQNKGVLNLFFTSLSSPTPPDASSCRLNPASQLWVRFYDNDLPGRPKPFTEWTQYMLEATRLAQQAAKVNYNHFPRRTYAVGTSNGGYQVRRAVEAAPDLFDGGVDWEGTFVDVRENILVTLPPAIENFPAYVASGFDPKSAAAQAILAAGYPPDIVKTNPADSLWLHYWAEFWEVTQCQWQKRFDPSWITYTDGPGVVDGPGGIGGTGDYNYFSRLAAGFVDVGQLEAITTTGKIKKPLITVAGTMDALLPIKKQARAYEDKVDASRKGNNAEREAQYRLYEVQNGNHIESYIPLFPNQLELIQPHAQKAFDLLVDHVENNAPLPPSQCIPKGGAISSTPSEPGHCVQLLVP